MRVPVQIYTEFNHEHGLPIYETAGAAAMDVRANEAVEIRPGETKLIKTGIYVAIPPGFEIQIRPRSGLSWKTKMRVANAPGTIDSDFRGDICIIAENTGNDDLKFPLGDRVAQIKLAHVPLILWDQVEQKSDLGTTVRGEGGLGSTGSSASVAKAFGLDASKVEKVSSSHLYPMGSLGEAVEEEHY